MQIISPRSEVLRRLRTQRELIFARMWASYPNEKAFVDFCKSEVRDVVIVLGGARGGTSAFKDALSSSSSVISMRGEHRLFFTLLGLNFPDHGGPCEECAARALTAEQRAFILENIFAECGFETTLAPTPEEVELYGLEWALRLPLQWPEYEWDVDLVLHAVRDTWYSDISRWREQPHTLLQELLRRFGEMHPAVGEEFYDLELGPFKGPRSALTPQAFYENRVIIEISPYIAPLPRKMRVPPSERPILLLKASSDVYRIPQLQSLFAHRNVTFVHLARNPLASINGLMDGWRHPCFGQHSISSLGVPLSHRSEALLAHWVWKFDLFPTWADFVDVELEVRTAEQWLSSHAFIFESDIARCRMFHFERFQRGVASRTALFDEVCAFIGVKPDRKLRAQLQQPRIVNATSAPQIARWKRNWPTLRRLLEDERIRRMCHFLDYEVAECQRWE